MRGAHFRFLSTPRRERRRRPRTPSPPFRTAAVAGASVTQGARAACCLARSPARACVQACAAALARASSSGRLRSWGVSRGQRASRWEGAGGARDAARQQGSKAQRNAQPGTRCVGLRAWVSRRVRFFASSHCFVFGGACPSCCAALVFELELDLDISRVIRTGSRVFYYVIA